MKKKLDDSIIRINLIFLIMSLLTTIVLMVRVVWVLDRIKYGNKIYDINYTIFLLKVYATNYHNNSVYIIGNYPLIPIGAGIIYNLFTMTKNKIDS